MAYMLLNLDDELVKPIGRPLTVIDDLGYLLLAL
jgi:hypothetical protein